MKAGIIPDVLSDEPNIDTISKYSAVDVLCDSEEIDSLHKPNSNGSSPQETNKQAGRTTKSQSLTNIVPVPSCGTKRKFQEVTSDDPLHRVWMNSPSGFKKILIDPLNQDSF